MREGKIQIERMIDEEIKKIICAQYFDQFFDFEAMTETNYRSFWTWFANKRWSPELDSLVKLSRLTEKLRPFDSKSNPRITKAKSRFVLLVLYRALIEAIGYERCLQLPDEEINSYDDLVNLSNGANICFRGQENKEWGLVPSAFRDNNDTDIIDSQSLMDLYGKSGQSESYKKARQANDVHFNYDFLSWMQHSICFSPLIDFTYSPLVAATFAIRRDKPYHFCHWDSAILTIKGIDDNALLKALPPINGKIENMEVRCFKDKIVPLRCSGQSGNFTCYDFDWILNNLRPEIYLFDLPTNDRMKKQQGLFLFFRRCSIVNGNVFGLSKSGLLIKKYVVKPVIKSNIVQAMRKNYPDLAYNYLMNPY